MQSNIATDQNQVSYLAGNIKEYYKNFNSFNPQSDNGGTQAVSLNFQNGIKLHWFQPESVTDYSGTKNPQNPWGGEYAIASSSDGNYFSITQNHVPAQACAMLTAITNDAGGGGVVGTAITEDSGSTIGTPTVSTSSSPAYASSSICANGSTSNSYYTVTLMYGR